MHPQLSHIHYSFKSSTPKNSSTGFYRIWQIWYKTSTGAWKHMKAAVASQKQDAFLSQLVCDLTTKLNFPRTPILSHPNYNYLPTSLPVLLSNFGKAVGFCVFSFLKCISWWEFLEHYLMDFQWHRPSPCDKHYINAVMLKSKRGKSHL